MLGFDLFLHKVLHLDLYTRYCNQLVVDLCAEFVEDTVVERCREIPSVNR